MMRGRMSVLFRVLWVDVKSIAILTGVVQDVCEELLQKKIRYRAYQ